jgi:cell division protein FtsW
MRQKGPIDPIFLGVLGGIVLFGLMMLLSASGPLGYSKFGDSWYFFKNQLTRGVVPGMILFYAVSLIDYRKLRPYASFALLGSIALLILVYLPGLGQRYGGSGRWVDLGLFTFQPSELVKVLFPVYVAAWLAASRGERIKSVNEGLIPFLAATGVIMLLLVLQPNTGSMSVIIGSALIMYLVAGASIAWFVGLAAAGVGLIALLIKFTPYRAARFMTFLHPELDPQGIGYHVNQAFLAVGSGGLFGLGYGHSRQKYQYLPEVAGDSVFAVIAEEMGFVLTVCFLAALAYLVHRIFVIARNAPDDFGRYLATGIGSWIAIQTVFNVSSMIGLMPITGVTLPFVSYGSSAIISTALGMGLIASISRFSRTSV